MLRERDLAPYNPFELIVLRPRLALPHGRCLVASYAGADTSDPMFPTWRLTVSPVPLHIAMTRQLPGKFMNNNITLLLGVTHSVMLSKPHEVRRVVATEN